VDHVNGAVEQLDQLTQQNAALVEQVTAASENLNAQMVSLSDLVGRFRVPALAH
jgi:methyl-accepting chemotaxis protein